MHDFVKPFYSWFIYPFLNFCLQHGFSSVLEHKSGEGLDYIYIYTDPDNYDIFKTNETLHDKKLDISFPLTDVFK